MKIEFIGGRAVVVIAFKHIGTGITVIALGLALPVAASGQDSPSQDSPSLEQSLVRSGKALLSLKEGESRAIFGATYLARESSTALVVLSSEFVSLAVLKGHLTTARRDAEAGQVLVSPIESSKTTRFLFDADILSRSLSPAMIEIAAPMLARIAARQKRQRFLGLIEPVGLNASAPAPARAEAIRISYLSDPAIIDIRQRAAGDIKIRGRMTAERFATALSTNDAETLATLIDPLPFTNVTMDAAQWRSARLGFAQSLIANAALVASLAQAHLSDAPEPKTFLLGVEGAPTYRITIVERDRASFVAALEPAL